MDPSLAFNEEQVLKLTGLSEWKLHHWMDSRVLTPDFARTFEGGPRLYSFQDLVGLRVLAQLREEHSLQALRRIGAFLAKVDEKPWSRLRLYVMKGGGVAFKDPETGRLISASGPQGQVIEELLVDLSEVSHALKKAVERGRKRPKNPKIVQRRGLIGNKPVIEGTRIPVEVIKKLHEANFSIQQILAEYPRLSEADVQAALGYEPPPPRRKKTA
jgi:uncharacterized protein (DUF433 family)